MRPVAWGDTLKESQLMSMVYEGLCGLNERTENRKEIAQ
jgi:glycerol-3-phosphate dehydrogenase [NAD(P)+ ], A subunit